MELLRYKPYRMAPPPFPGHGWLKTLCLGNSLSAKAPSGIVIGCDFLS